MKRSQLLSAVSICALTACMGAPRGTTLPSEGPAHAVPFVVRSAPAGSPPEYLQGVALISTDAIEVLVTDAQLAPDIPQARIREVRAALVEGDTARAWNVTRSSALVPVGRLRALAAAGGRDTVRLRIPRTRGINLADRWLAFQLAGEITPPGLAPGQGVRSLHGTRGGLHRP